MATKFTAGFTIIETMLFLAISGALVVALLAGTGASINIQRYRDATESFKSLLQSQYGEILSVNNDRENNWTCDSDAKTTEQPTTLVKGQSDCVLLGRYITITGPAISISSVTGYPTGSSSVGSDISRLISNYNLNVSTVNLEQSEMEWGTSIAWPKEGSQGSETKADGTTRSIAILLLRSPNSGLVYTFTADTVPDEVSSATLKNMLVTGVNSTPPYVGQKARYLCIDSGGLFTTSTQAVYISAYATGPTAVETRANDYISTLTGAEKEDLRC